MAKLTRMMKVKMYDEWVKEGSPDPVEYAKVIDIKLPLLERIIREGKLANLR